MSAERKHLSKNDLNRIYDNCPDRVKLVLDEVNQKNPFKLHPIIVSLNKKYDNKFDEFAEAEDPFSFVTVCGENILFAYWMQEGMRRKEYDFDLVRQIIEQPTFNVNHETYDENALVLMYKMSGVTKEVVMLALQKGCQVKDSVKFMC